MYVKERILSYFLSWILFLICFITFFIFENLTGERTGMVWCGVIRLLCCDVVMMWLLYGCVIMIWSNCGVVLWCCSMIYDVIWCVAVWQYCLEYSGSRDWVIEGCNSLSTSAKYCKKQHHASRSNNITPQHHHTTCNSITPQYHHIASPSLYNSITITPKQHHVTTTIHHYITTT